jgi:vacuolar-type H+-ATPase subunit I/STV1
MYGLKFHHSKHISIINKAWFILAILSAILCFWRMQISELAHKSIESLFRSKQL